MSRYIPLTERINANVIVRPNGCWMWAGLIRNGYGVFTSKGKNHSAHIVSLELSEGRPQGLVAMHQCHNKACCNPAHIRWGTQKQNCNDGRKLTGESLGTSKLTEKDVDFILSSNLTADELAVKFNMERSTFYKIRKGDLWNDYTKIKA